MQHQSKRKEKGLGRKSGALSGERQGRIQERERRKIQYIRLNTILVYLFLHPLHHRILAFWHNLRKMILLRRHRRLLPPPLLTILVSGFSKH